MKKQQKTLALWIVVILLMALAMKALEKKDGEYDTISYSEFINAVENNKVEEVTFKGSSTIEGQYIKGYVGSSKNGTTFKLTGNTGDETFRILRNCWCWHLSRHMFGCHLYFWGELTIPIFIFSPDFKLISSAFCQTTLGQR